MACLCEAPLCWIALTATIVGLIKWYMQGGKFTKNTTASGKVVIVTGSNTGIGKETVLELAKRNATIYMACRDMEKCGVVRQEIISQTGNNKIYARKLDLCSLKSIRDFVDTFKKDESRLDILINNAGVMRCPLLRTENGFEMQIGVNHMGHFLLTNLLLDLLKKSAPSRIVVLSSIAHKMGKINKEDLNGENSYHPWTAYYQSKLANVLFVRELSKRLQGTKVTVNALHPGVVESELTRYIPLLNFPVIKYIFNGIYWVFSKTTRNGAQTSIYAALDPDLETVSGMYFSDCNLKEVAPAGKDDEMAKWLWEESEKWTKLNE